MTGPYAVPYRCRLCNQQYLYRVQFGHHLEMEHPEEFLACREVFHKETEKYFEQVTE